MAFRLAVFDPGEFWRHGVDSGRLAKLDQLASSTLIEAKIVSFSGFFRRRKTIADGYLPNRQAIFGQRFTAESATE
jgi:hypothetical protein